MACPRQDGTFHNRREPSALLASKSSGLILELAPETTDIPDAPSHSSSRVVADDPLCGSRRAVANVQHERENNDLHVFPHWMPRLFPREHAVRIAKGYIAVLRMAGIVDVNRRGC